MEAYFFSRDHLLTPIAWWIPNSAEILRRFSQHPTKLALTSSPKVSRLAVRLCVLSSPGTYEQDSMLNSNKASDIMSIDYAIFASVTDIINTSSETALLIEYGRFNRNIPLEN